MYNAYVFSDVGKYEVGFLLGFGALIKTRKQVLA